MNSLDTALRTSLKEIVMKLFSFPPVTYSGLLFVLFALW